MSSSKQRHLEGTQGGPLAIARLQPAQAAHIGQLHVETFEEW